MISNINSNSVLFSAFLVEGISIPRSVIPKGYSHDNNKKVTHLLEAARQSLISGDNNLSLARSAKLKSILHDATSHQGDEYLALGIRHLNAARTRPVNTFVALDTVTRRDALTQATCIASMMSKVLFPDRSKYCAATSISEKDSAEVVWESVIVSIGRD